MQSPAVETRLLQVTWAFGFDNEGGGVDHQSGQHVA